MTSKPSAYHIEEASFLEHWPSYGSPNEIEDLRASPEFKRLDDNKHVYVDYTGGGLYAESQLDKPKEYLASNVYGNPHSINPTSIASTERVELARQKVLSFFNASPDEYACIFTHNASGALKLVGEAFPFDKKSQYILTADNHNSVVGIREYAKAKGAKVMYASMQGQEVQIDNKDLVCKLKKARKSANNLFAFPAQSNFTGTQHSLELIEIARRRNHYVLVDFAAYAPTNKIDMSVWKPDFATFSFYKIFGYTQPG